MWNDGGCWHVGSWSYNGLRLLLQDKTTRRFLSKSGIWSDDFDGAWEFESPSEAIKFCVATRTWNADIILRFRRFGETVDFPLDDTSFALAQVRSAAAKPRSQASRNEYSIQA